MVLPLALFFLVSLIIFLFIFYKTDCDFILLYYSWRGSNLDSLKGKVVWITGASSGIGECLAYTLARYGSKVILSARRTENLEKVLQKCKEVSPADNRECHMVLPLDVLDYDAHQQLAKQVHQTYGKIDYLVNNAGRSQRSSDENTKLEVIDLLLRTNTLGSISLTKAVLPYMIQQKAGCFVYTSSIAGKIGTPGSAGYAASKHALQGYLDTIRMEYHRRGISVLSICPGPIHSGFLREVIGKDLKKESMVIDETSTGDRMSVERCTYLMAIAMANSLEEVWITKQPILLFVYLTQYFPNFSKRLGKRIGIRRLEAIEGNKSDIDSSFLIKK